MYGVITTFVGFTFLALGILWGLGIFFKEIHGVFLEYGAEDFQGF